MGGLLLFGYPIFSLSYLAENENLASQLLLLF